MSVPIPDIISKVDVFVEGVLKVTEMHADAPVRHILLVRDITSDDITLTARAATHWQRKLDCANVKLPESDAHQLHIKDIRCFQIHVAVGYYEAMCVHMRSVFHRTHVRSGNNLRWCSSRM